MIEIDLDRRPHVEPERASAGACADVEQRLRREDAAAQALAPGDALELTQLLQRVDADVRVRADRDGDAALEERPGRYETVPEVGLGRRADADGAPVGSEEVELGVVRVRAVDDRRPLAEAAAPRQELYRPQAVLGEALLDLSRLLVGVHVQWERLSLGIRADLLEPVGGTGPDGVGGDTDARSPHRAASRPRSRNAATDGWRNLSLPPRA